MVQRYYRECAETEFKSRFLIFSDGTDEELAMLTALPNTERYSMAMRMQICRTVANVGSFRLNFLLLGAFLVECQH